MFTIILLNYNEIFTIEPSEFPEHLYYKNILRQLQLTVLYNSHS